MLFSPLGLLVVGLWLGPSVALLVQLSDTSSVRRAPGASVGDFTLDIFLPLPACHDPALS